MERKATVVKGHHPPPLRRIKETEKDPGKWGIVGPRLQQLQAICWNSPSSTKDFSRKLTRGRQALCRRDSWRSWIEYLKGDSRLILATHVKKTSLGESLAGSHAYNPIRDSRRDSWWDFLARKVLPTVWPWVLPRVSARVSDRIICMTPGETLSETRFFTRGDLPLQGAPKCPDRTNNRCRD